MCLTWRQVVQDELTRIDYKPTSTLSAVTNWDYSYPDGDAGVDLVVCFNCDDSRNEGQKFELKRSFQIPWHVLYDFYNGYHSDALQDFVYDRLVEVELHEVGEWFKVDDVLTHDPHAGEKEEAAPEPSVNA